ncbi:hypothetical protein Tco_1038679 [Tanacetum coccineum]
MGEFGPSLPFNNGAKYRVGPPGYYMRVDNQPPYGEKRPSLEELMNKHLEESSRKRAKMEEWVKNETNTSPNQCKLLHTNNEAPLNNPPLKISYIFTKDSLSEGSSSRTLPCQLPLKELNLGNFTLPCTIGNQNLYALSGLGTSVNVIPKSMFEHLKLARLTKTDMKVKMADATKRTPLGIVENVLVKINKFLFPSDFVVMDMLNNHNETMILGRPFLATINAEIDVLNKEISLGIGELMFWPTCDPNKEQCNGGIEVYVIDEEGTLKKWYFDGDRGKVEKGTENFNLRPKDYHFKDWLLTRVGHTDVSNPVKETLLKTWLVNCFQEDLVKDPQARSFDDYKFMFVVEIDLLANEYDIRMGKKGHILDDIWEYYKKV